jgi:eukaryotic-like serine/threonine-protein kinase
VTRLLDRFRAALGGRYELERELGAGGMAVVYLATDPRHGRRVAIKVLRPELARAIGAERFLREIGIAARLSHPNILPLHDSGEADGFLYYVMPFVEGESLRDRLDRETQLGLEEALRIARQVGDALSHAHGAGVIHRDIKPENILFQAGHAVVSDFGVARALSESGGVSLTETGLAVGTPVYMSPEQAMAAGPADARADIYALGCVLYEMLAGEPPYSGATPQAILARKAVDAVPRLRVIRDTVPEALEAVITRALAKLPADRYPTVAELMRALDRAMPPGGTTGVGAATSGPVRARRIRGRTAVAGALLIAGTAAGGWWVTKTLAGDAPQLQSLAVLPFENLTGDPEQEYLLAGMHDALIGELARLDALRVVSRRSVLRYAASDDPVTEIARELNVDGVVAASFGRTGDSVRVRVQLLRAGREERSLWSQAYDRDLGGALVMQGEVAAAIARAVGVRLTAEQAGRMEAPRRVNRDAFEAYLRGRHAITQGTPESVQRGLAYLHEANERDPADPYPYVGLALGYSILGHGPRPEVLPRAIAAARRALELDSTLAEPHAVLAQAKLYRDWDWPGAERDFRRALQMNPSLADARAHHAWYLQLMGRRDEALAEMRRAIDSDPLDPVWPAWLGSLHSGWGEYEAAIAEAGKALELQPNLPVGLYVLGRAYQGLGRYEEAIAVHERAAALSPQGRAVLAVTYASAGRLDDARALVPELEANPVGVILWELPGIHAHLGDRERALDWLERVFDLPHPWAPWARRYPELASLREEPRFRALVARLNLPD